MRSAQNRDRPAGRSLDFQAVDHDCPSCGYAPLVVFYEVDDVPVHSCLMLDDRHAALEFPRADIALGLCKACGFICNTRYDPKQASYAENYEDQQTFSTTFNRFAQDLARDLVGLYDLNGKTIVEIGCSKGDFLTLLCELGDNRGVGIDPSAVVGRVKSPESGRIEFIKEYYSERHSAHACNLIVCRHTLEHIAPVGDFMALVRRTMDAGAKTPLFFELPETRRVLKSLAFEDIYYEHCSYFTPGSLARLFAASGFAVTNLATAYDEQYLLIHALPADRPRPLPDLAEPVAEAVREARHFASHIDRHLGAWRETLMRLHHVGGRTVIWGSGSKCVAFLTTLGLVDEIEYVVDINPHRHGRYIPGLAKEVMPPEFLKSYRPDRVIVMNSIYRREIKDRLDSLGVPAEIIVLQDR